MRAIHITPHGGPHVLTPVDLEVPTPGPGEALVRTTAIGVNYIDTYFREGVYQTDLPYTPGSEGAGVIEALGEGTRDLAVGDRVLWGAGLRWRPLRSRSADRAGRRDQVLLPLPKRNSYRQVAVSFLLCKKI